MATGVTTATTITDIHNNLGNSECITCHSSHDAPDAYNFPANTVLNIRTPQSLQLSGTTPVIGNITLITSMGQDWYQQGIKGPDGSGTDVNDKSWGWTFFDENPASGYIIPSEKVTQTNNIYALLLDDGNNSNPITGAHVSANVTYWIYNGTNYTSHLSSILLEEDTTRRGFYSGSFNFYGGTAYATGGNMQNCDGCHHSMFHGSDSVSGYFPGNYTVLITAEAYDKTVDANVNFEVTPWGCEDCHGSGNQHRSSAQDRHIVSSDMDSACYICHSVNDLSGMYNAGNPHQNTAHINIGCMECHTNRSLNSQNFNGVTFENGGLNNASIPQYNYNTISLTKGTHSNLECTTCHGNLTLLNIQGGYKLDNYTIDGMANKYDPSFTSIQQFQDYYVINVEGTEGPLSINLEWEGASNIGFYLYPPGFNPRNFTNTALNDGSTFTNKPEIYTNSVPAAGKWILQIYGYNLRTDWIGELQPQINYTINSTYPIQIEKFPSIPECNNCHNSEATGEANTIYEIPDWNPGFAHVDSNGDGSFDIQCRMCHDTMHDITIKNCQNCHTTAPTNHPISNPAFAEYTPAQCLNCHGDPHNVTSAGGTDCIACHTPNDINISKFGNHANVNTSDGPDNVTNNDCWACHKDNMAVNGSYLKHIDATDSLDDVYSSDNFSICFNCHQPEKLLAAPQPDIFMRVLLNTSLKIPLYNTTWATNFYGDSWWKNNADSNLHYFHLVELRAMGGVPSTGAYCAKCHNPHGTSRPAFIVDNLNFSYLYQNGSVITDRNEWNLNYGGIINGFNGTEYQFCGPCHGSDNRYMHAPLL